MSENNLVIAGVDDGHFAVKVVLEDGTTYSIPSRGKTGGRMILLDDDTGQDAIYRTEEGTDITVSSHIEEPDDTRFYDYPKSALNLALVHHALRMSGLGDKNVVIATGLPVSYYFLEDGSKNDVLIQAKRQNLQKKISCGNWPVANIVANMVSSEAVAAYFDQLMDMQGEESEDYEDLIQSTVGIIDIGGKTTDSAVLLPGGRQVSAERSGSSDIGVLSMYSAITSRLRAEFDLANVPPRLVESAISTNTVRISGQSHDVTEIVNVEKQRLADQIVASVRTKIGDGKDLDFMLFIGGGSIVMHDQLKHYFGNCRIADKPEFANARGMFKIAKYVFADEVANVQAQYD